MNTSRLRKFQMDRDLWAGVVFVAIAIAALALGTDLTVGTAAEMGEGYVPRAMAIVLLAFGVLIVALAVWRGSSPSQSPAEGREAFVQWRPLGFVTAAVVAFAVALEPLGLIPATVLSTTAANFAGQPLSVRSLAILVCVLSAIVAVVFVWGLGLPLHLLPR
jgi:hypothetical protein